MVNLPGLVAMFILVIAACSSIRKKPPLKTGDIYSVDLGNNSFGVMKVLMIASDRIYVKKYIDLFQYRPEMIDASSLTMGGVEMNEGEDGVFHIIVFDKVDFNALKPEVAANEVVTPAELAACDG